MNTLLSFIYQWLIFLPILVISTVITAISVMIGCTIGNHKFWGYIPPKYWSQIVCRAALCRIKVIKNAKVECNKSYVFIANHQGAFDVFLIYGYLNNNIKWVQKQELRNIPFVGKASEIAGHVFVDNSNMKAMIDTIDKSQRELNDGTSMVIFPEGARTGNGKMARFKKGAYIIAKQMQLPIVPLTINGSYDVLKIGSLRLHFFKRMELVIHDPIETKGMTDEEIGSLMRKTYATIESGLWDEYKEKI